MNIGIIDLGTNSARFFIYSFIEGGELLQQPKLVFKQKQGVRLGDGLFESLRLTRDAKERTLEAFKAFGALCKRQRVTDIRAVATSALRDAIDGYDFIQEVSQQTGIQIEVISGTREAELIARGILAHADIPTSPTLLVDIGGGSVELSIATKSTLHCSCCLPLGAARAQQLFLKEIPPSPGGVEKLRSHLRATLKNEAIAFAGMKLAIGSSGSIRALSRIHHAEFGGIRAFSRENLRQLVERMIPMNRDELSALPALEPRRVDLILSASIVLEEILDFYAIPKVKTTSLSLKDGLLAEISAELR